MKKYFFILSFLLLIIFFCPAALAYNFNESSGINKAAQNAGYDQTSDPQTFLATKIGLAISIIVSFVGVILLLLIVYGGYLWMTAMGNESQVDKAKNIIKNSIIGVIIVFSAYAITYIFKNFFNS